MSKEMTLGRPRTDSCYTVYVGLTSHQYGERETIYECREAIRRLMFEHRFSYTMELAYGGYVYDTGEFYEQPSVVMTFIGLDEDNVKLAAEAICKVLKQDVAMITRQDTTITYLT